MSIGAPVQAPHLDDGALLRLLDRECSAGEGAQLAAHIATCDDCNRRHRALAAWSRGTSELLVRADAPARVFALSRNGRRPRIAWRWWSAAAAVVLLMGGTVAVAAPMRMWMVQRWAALRGALHSTRTEQLAPTPTGDHHAQAASPALGEVSFTPDSDVLVVRIASRQVEGSLVLETSSAPTASATVRGQGEHEAIVVLPSELHIANQVGSRATYRLTLSARLKRVVVVIAGGAPLSFTPPASGDSRTVDLQMKGRP